MLSPYEQYEKQAYDVVQVARFLAARISNRALVNGRMHHEVGELHAALMNAVVELNEIGKSVDSTLGGLRDCTGFEDREPGARKPPEAAGSASGSDPVGVRGYLLRG